MVLFRRDVFGTIPRVTPVLFSLVCLHLRRLSVLHMLAASLLAAFVASGASLSIPVSRTSTKNYKQAGPALSRHLGVAKVQIKEFEDAQFYGAISLGTPAQSAYGN